MEVDDNVIPSSNSEMARNLFYLGQIYYNEDYVEKSRQMLYNVKKQISNNGAHYSNWASLLTNFIYQPSEVAIMGNNAHKIRIELDENFLPSVIMAGSTKESYIPLLEYRYQKSSTKIYVCKDKVCKLPVENVKDALKQIK